MGLWKHCFSPGAPSSLACHLLLGFEAVLYYICLTRLLRDGPGLVQFPACQDVLVAVFSLAAHLDWPAVSRQVVIRMPASPVGVSEFKSQFCSPSQLFANAHPGRQQVVAK